MSELKATKGPWIAQKDHGGGKDDWCIGIEGAPIDYVAVCNERDAHLIAASPDLYRTLSHANDCLVLLLDPHFGLSATDRKIIMDQCTINSAQLAKARGEI